MTDLKEKLADFFNLIFINDLRKTKKGKSFWFNWGFLFIVYLIIFWILLSNPSFKSEAFKLNCYRILAFFFLTAVTVIPLEVRFLTIRELENDNIFFIFMSNITAYNFIKGKLLLGVFYNVILLLAAIPVNAFIYFTGGIDLFRLIRIFYYTCIIPIPVILFLVYEGLHDGRGGKLSVYFNGIGNLVGILATGFFYVRVIGVEGIRDVSNEYAFGLVIADLVIGFIIFISALLAGLFLYSYITKIYPMSEINTTFVPKLRNSFSSDYKKDILPKTVDRVKNSLSQSNIVLERRTAPSTNNIDLENEIKPSSDISSNRILKPVSSFGDSSELRRYQSDLIRINNKERISSESMIKMLITGLGLLFLFIIPFKTFFGMIGVDLVYFIFPFLCAYFHSRETIYDNRSKLEIPEPGLKRIIKFPFVSGYANGVIWLFLCYCAYGFVLLLTYGFFEPESGKAYFVRDLFPGGGFFVVMAFMLNIFSWCFLGRYLADNFMKYDVKDNKALSTIFTLILVTSFMTAFTPKGQDNPLSMINYFSPTMPSLTAYFFFEKPSAFIFNLIFFIVTLIPNAKTLIDQINSYFSYDKNS